MEQLVMIAGFLIEAVVFIAAVTKIYTDFRVRMEELTLRVTHLEAKGAKDTEKLDKILEMITDLRVELQDKQDRI